MANPTDPRGFLDFSDPSTARDSAVAVSERAHALLQAATAGHVALLDDVGAATLIFLGALIVDARGGDLEQLAPHMHLLPSLVAPDIRQLIRRLVWDLDHPHVAPADGS